jgi:hypothetical protein
VPIEGCGVKGAVFWCSHALVIGTCPPELWLVQTEDAGAAVGHGLSRADRERKLHAKVARLPHRLGAVGARHLVRVGVRVGIRVRVRVRVVGLGLGLGLGPGLGLSFGLESGLGQPYT